MHYTKVALSDLPCGILHIRSYLTCRTKIYKLLITKNCTFLQDTIYSRRLTRKWLHITKPLLFLVRSFWSYLNWTHETYKVLKFYRKSNFSFKNAEILFFQEYRGYEIYCLTSCIVQGTNNTAQAVRRENNVSWDWGRYAKICFSPHNTHNSET